MIEASEVARMGRILAGIGIVVNLPLPGVGTLIMGKWSSGIIQTAVLAFVMLLRHLSFSIIGFITFPVAGGLFGIIWVWALIGGILTYIERGHHDALRPPRY